jgi:hypothetical protein
MKGAVTVVFSVVDPRSMMRAKPSSDGVLNRSHMHGVHRSMSPQPAVSISFQVYLYFFTVCIIKRDVHERANPLRGGGAKPRAFLRTGSRVAERRLYTVIILSS